jgi:hypothetical protein
MDNCIYGGNLLDAAAAEPDGILGKSSSPFGLIFLGISLWGYVLISYGAGKTEGKENDQ